MYGTCITHGVDERWVHFNLKTWKEGTTLEIFVVMVVRNNMCGCPVFNLVAKQIVIVLLYVGRS
jgi:hypothetical protein